VPNHAATGPVETPRRQLKLLMWPLVVALLFGVLGLGEPIEDSLRVLRNKAHIHPASGEIALVQVDDKSRNAVGEWPWPRAKQADLVNKLNDLGAREIIADINYLGPTRPADDKALATALSNVAYATIATLTRRGSVIEGDAMGSYEPFAAHANVATASLESNWQRVVWRAPAGHWMSGRYIPSISWVSAGRKPLLRDQDQWIDYSIDPATIPTFSASDVLAGRVSRSALAGKTVLFGTNSFIIGDQYFLPGWDKRGGVYIHALAAETLAQGTPRDASWWPAVLLALAGAWLAIQRGNLAYLVVATALIIVAPMALEPMLVFPQIIPALVLSSIVMARTMWSRLRSRELVNALTGLPNLLALRTSRAGRDKALVGVRVHNYAEIASTLNAEGERQLVEQIAQRLTVGNRERVIYQGDEGIFAWFADKDTPFASQLEALHALFRSPVRVDKTSYDIALSFGVELGSSRSVSSRLGSALVAAQEADAESLKWKFYDPARLQEVPWRLSLLSQLDEAIAKGEVWLAFQPKLDLKTRQTVGAEALARWTHPEKGPISPTEFISAAEQSDRIEHLTDFVLDQAIGAAAQIARDGNDFDVAVNLSARLLNDRGLPARVGGFLTRHGLPAGRLTLELTETAAVSGTGMGLDILGELRAMGVKIAIDDYGTGLSTLEYLRKVPASEIKIDQSFIRSMRDNRSDLIMVQSTITLAKSLGRTVVAEGVEDALSLEQLKTMGCDQVQGFIVGRPMPINELRRRLANEKRRSSAA
jgi:diguanylate cyclase